MRKSPSIRHSLALVLAMQLAAACAESSWADESDARVDFVHSVVPILKKYCVECHGGRRLEGDFSLNTRQAVLDAGVVEPGKGDGSYLIELVTSDDAEIRMPKNKPPLTEAEVAVLREWIDAGLPWEPGFTFALQEYEVPLRPRLPELPPPIEGRENPIDRIVDAYLKEHKVPRPEPLDDSAFLRRAYLDIVGVLPTSEKLHAFLASDNPQKRSHVIEELLADNRNYAEHWLTFWNDLLRNDYQGTGYIEGGRKSITAWLYRALFENMPFDQFVRALISPLPESEGFSYGITWRGAVNASQTRELQFAQNVSQVFLGINMKCASCHDSFIDRWTLAETYALAAIYADAPLEIYRCDKPTGKFASPAWPFPELGQIDAASPRDERLRRLAELMATPENGRLSRTIVNRLWHRLMGRGIVHPVDAMRTAPWSVDLLDYLASDLSKRGYDIKHVIRLIVSSQAYQSQPVVLDNPPDESNFVYTGPIAKRMTAEQFIDAVWQLTNTGPNEPHPSFAAILTSEQRADRMSFRASMVSSDPIMRSLGRPNREQVVTDRPALLTTLQALDLSNSMILAELLERGALSMQSQLSAQGPAAVVDSLYESALSRIPTMAERQMAVELLDSPPTPQGIEDLLWVMIMLPEFQIIR